MMNVIKLNCSILFSTTVLFSITILWPFHYECNKDALDDILNRMEETMQCYAVWMISPVLRFVEQVPWQLTLQNLLTLWSTPLHLSFCKIHSVSMMAIACLWTLSQSWHATLRLPRIFMTNSPVHIQEIKRSSFYWNKPHNFTTQTCNVTFTVYNKCMCTHLVLLLHSQTFDYQHFEMQTFDYTHFKMINWPQFFYFIIIFL